ncbi:acetyl-CoA carboxylase biotin carboxyl carrier protein [Robiginitomaculum antarcticum]|uniref:acetyl-CoA carboxylase biotin carboxyl carrier protein n=1 Tax=Robiginitomaculum antarcticum TaxID=437507 RepID=UPI00037FE6CE|nr:acetyl-CoA carboxylase biotin carboxyl carrier protein [Robiginitomaculum antarcticum]
MARTPSKSSPKKPPQTSTAETKLVRELAKILNETDLSEIEMEKGTLKIRVARGGAAVMMSAPASAPMQTPAPSAAPAAATPPIASKPEAHTDAQKSPMVGTAYVRPSPEADSFVSVGDTVKEGDTIMLIEAMKTFNPIGAEKSGTILDILVEDAQPVEFGEPLFVIG